jgi:HAD superfamily hydrolase (TIGR01662 family)
MQPVRAVLFDYGHTLVDFRRTEEALLDAYRQISARIEAVAYMEVPELLDLVERVAGGIERVIEESYAARRLEELDQSALLRESFAAIGFDLPDDVLAHVVALDHSAYSNSITAEPATMATLTALKDAGYRMGLVSNVTLLPALMREDLTRLGFDAFLEATVFSSEVGVRKPDPRIFRAALDRLGADPGETVFVGDRRFDDVTGAQAVGMRGVQTLQFRQEDEPADVVPDGVVRTLSELPGLLRSWGGP